MSNGRKGHGSSCDGCLMVGLIAERDAALDRADRAEAREAELRARVEELAVKMEGIDAVISPMLDHPAQGAVIEFAKQLRNLLASAQAEPEVDPVCVCGSELSSHSGHDGHTFVDAAHYFGDKS